MPSPLRPALALVAAAVALGLAPALAGAQDARCSAMPAGGDACQKAVDLFSYLNPQMGTLIAGGNATLGQPGTLGGPGRFAVTLRANGTGDLRIPDLSATELDAGAPRADVFPVMEEAGAFPVLDAAVGVFRGMDLGAVRVGGVDALVNVFYLPRSVAEQLETGELTLGLPGGGMRLGWGGRVGILEGARVLPDISATYIRRGLPALDLTFATESSAAASADDSLSLRDLSVRTAAWRVVAGKKLGILAVAAGIGQDRYESDGELGYAVMDDGGGRVAGTIAFAPRATATNVFAGLMLDLFLLQVAAELGRVWGADVHTFNRFATPADEPRVYGALGLRIGH